MLVGVGVKGCIFNLFILKMGEVPVHLNADNGPQRGKLMLEQLRGLGGWGETGGVAQATPRWRGNLSPKAATSRSLLSWFPLSHLAHIGLARSVPGAECCVCVCVCVCLVLSAVWVCVYVCVEDRRVSQLR